MKRILKWSAAAFLGMILATWLCGCSPPCIRGDGSLAVVVVHPSIQHVLINSGAIDLGPRNPSMEDAVCYGAHYWDLVGARVRCEREAGNESYDTSVTVDATTDFENEFDSAWAAWYLPGIHLIRVVTPITCSDMVTCGSTMAHEIGHALGLNHVGDDTSVMSSTAFGREALSQSDVDEFHRHWPGISP